MKKEFKKIITQKGQKICQITTIDERWYSKEFQNQITGLPEYRFFPSVTWIKSYYYMSPYLMRWISEKGLTESERIRDEAGRRGDKVHQATEDIDKGAKIKLDDGYLNKKTGEMEELDVKEIQAIKSYVDYIDEVQPELLANEMTIFSKDGSAEEYAGTLDRIWASGFVSDKVRQIWIIDLKTSKSIYKDMMMQVSAYSNSDIDYKGLGITDEEWENRKLAILQLGYTRNKKGYKFTEIPDRYDLFKIAYLTWKEENPDSRPHQKDFPLEISSKFRIKQIKIQEKEKLKKKKEIDKKKKEKEKKRKEIEKKKKEKTKVEKNNKK